MAPVSAAELIRCRLSHALPRAVILIVVTRTRASRATIYDAAETRRRAAIFTPRFMPHASIGVSRIMAALLLMARRAPPRLRHATPARSRQLPQPATAVDVGF